MLTRALVFTVVALVATTLSTAAALAASAVGGAPAEAEQAALRFGNGLAKGDLTAGYQLLSSASRKHMDGAQWEEAYRLRPSPRMPQPQDLLRALASAPEPPTIGEVAISGGETLVEVGGTVRITHQLVMVQEGGSWFVDLAASDQRNARAAVQTYLEAVAAGSPAAAQRLARATESSLSMLKAMFVPEAKEFYVLDSSVEGDRAVVTLACDLPVHLVLRAVRSGPGWTIDLTRTWVNTNPLSPDPLKEAQEANIQATCQEQLRQLGRALQMYASDNADTLPDADHWVERIQRYLGESPQWHCPNDSRPGVSYAMNRNLSGKKRGQIGNQPTTPLLFESTLHTANPADTGESWAAPPFHAAGNNVLFLDGSVRPATQKPSFAIVEGQRPAAAPRAPTPRLEAVPAPRPQ